MEQPKTHIRRKKDVVSAAKKNTILELWHPPTAARQAAGTWRTAPHSERAQPVAGMGCTNERICSIRPAFTWPRAMAIITASANPTRTCILALPRMK